MTISMRWWRRWLARQIRVEHRPFRIGQIAEVRRVRSPGKLFSPVHITPDQAHNRSVRIAQNERHSANQQKPAQRSGQLNIGFEVSAVDEDRVWNLNASPANAAAHEDERIA